MSYTPDPAHRALWRAARTLDDLGELTAQWLEGRISYVLGYGTAAPDEETIPLVPVLADLNRHGYVTAFSQPGVPLDEDGDGQRAAVSGFCTEQTAQRIKASLLRTELVVVAYPGGSDVAPSIVATVYGGENVWVGGATSPSDLADEYGEGLGLAGLDALCNAWQVDILDPVWGRTGLLWERLSAVWVGERS
ncbi:DUF6919 domain-containing protein [Streptomyces sp. NPDC101152]|uniref:DUF6919 domain-containing protein n=1 Tax=Streptomyces sp. NPDC101152 TaxID=3366116 RepID=UPI0037F12B39